MYSNAAANPNVTRPTYIMLYHFLPRAPHQLIFVKAGEQVLFTVSDLHSFCAPLYHVTETTIARGSAITIKSLPGNMGTLFILPFSVSLFIATRQASHHHQYHSSISFFKAGNDIAFPNQI